MLSAVWLIPALPLAGFVLLVVAGRRLGDPWAGWLATAMVGGSFAAGVVTFAGLVGEDAEERQHLFRLFTWLDVGGFTVDMGFLVDPLSMVMVLFVTGVGTLIHLYSIGYMREDPRFPTFFVYLNLFAFSMLMLVLGDNLLVTFLGWEGVGACSYLLVSFWFERNSAAVAGKKAFVTNRVGDVGFMIAMFLTFSTLGTLTYVTEEGGGILESAGSLPEVTAFAIAALLLLGAAGKSAQLPLFVWLPDAMEGPTPVSALIHAATMVTSGVYLLCRMNPVIAQAPEASTLIVVVGAATAVFAATIAVAQRDIKRVLAYSTISQLGFMFVAVGAGGYVAAVFHMVTHAFFKALLFMGAGSVIHGLHEEQDMRHMGALRKAMPITAVTFLVGWLAISGIPPFAGFWSKDDILLFSWEKSPILFAVMLLAAGLTAYYMSRQVFLVFYGQPRWGDAGHGDADALERPEHEPATAAEAEGDEAVHGQVDDLVHAQGDGQGGVTPHESPPLMWIPLAALAFLSLVGGALNLPFGDLHFLETWLEPVFEGNEAEIGLSNLGRLAMAVAATVVSGGAILLARALYVRSTRPTERYEPEILRRGWRVDEALAAFMSGPGRAVADLSASAVDRAGIDGAVNGLATLVRSSGDRLRVVQTGYVRNYALGMAVGAVLLLGFFVSRAGL